MVTTTKLHISNDLFVANRNAIFGDGFYSLFYENSQNIFFITDAHYKIIDCNKFMSDCLGYTNKELKALPSCVDLFTVESKAHSIELTPDYVDRGSIKNIELQIKKKNGDIIDVSVNAIIVRDKAGMPLYNLITWYDITELVAARKTILQQAEILRFKYEELEQRNDELNTFSHIIVHDLKSPLRSVNFHAQQIVDDVDNVLSENSQQALTNFRNKLKKMDKLINEVFAYFFDSGENEPYEQFCTDKFFANIIDTLPIPLGFEVDYSNVPKYLFTKKILLRHVLLNLLSNATKYHPNPSQGKAIIECMQHNDWYHFRIIDNGFGIPEEFKQTIFKPLTRLQTDAYTEGTGLGLAIVDKIVHHQNGTIHVESQVGVGSTFMFTWPVNH